MTYLYIQNGIFTPDQIVSIAVLSIYYDGIVLECGDSNTLSIANTGNYSNSGYLNVGLPYKEKQVHLLIGDTTIDGDLNDRISLPIIDYLISKDKRFVVIKNFVNQMLSNTDKTSLFNSIQLLNYKDVEYEIFQTQRRNKAVSFVKDIFLRLINYEGV